MADPSFRVIRIVTATDLEKEKGDQIATRFAEQHGIHNYEIHLEVDPSLIGGMVIFAGGFRYDYSIKGQLGRIASQLKSQKPLEETLGEQDINEQIHTNLSLALETFSENPVAPGGQDAFWNAEPAQLGENEASTHLLIDRFRETLESLSTPAMVDEIGQVLSISDGVAYVRGIQNCKSDELIMFGQNTYGIAMNLEEERVGVVILTQAETIQEGSICKRTGTTVSVPVGKEMLGRVVDPLGNPLDGLGAIVASSRRPLESPAPSIIDRQPVTVSLHTGITAIDALTPIGRGQRELIIGDRQTGKTAIAIDAILNQKDKGVYCVYVAIGQKMSTIASLVHILDQHGALAYTTVVVASASMSAAIQYMAPYAGCAIAEELMYKEKSDVLIIYDDLTKHAQAYRAISLLMRRPPGREAYPGDIFYLHSRLLERAGRLSDHLGGGSITALPIVETQGGDISAYIPTNVISITDGQIYLETELFFSGQRPAINVGLSVSRVGGAAQTKAMKKVAGPLRINLAQYRELESFSQFGSDLDPATLKTLRTGERLLEVVKQPQYSPLPMQVQVIMLYLATRDVLRELDREDVHDFLDGLIRFTESRHSELLESIRTTGQFTDANAATVDALVREYRAEWAPRT